MSLDWEKKKNKSASPIRRPPVLNFRFDQAAGLLMRSKVLQPEPLPVQTLECLSDSEMICYANHYSYLTTCRVATLVLMAPHTGRSSLMLTATPSAACSSHGPVTPLINERVMVFFMRDILVPYFSKYVQFRVSVCQRI